MNQLLRAILFSLLLFPIVAQASAGQLPQSGQTASYAANDDGDFRIGKPWPDPRFSDDYNGTLADHLTGLIWAKDANLLKSRDSGFDTDGIGGDGMVTWQHALDYIKKLNSENYLGYCDWRLANLNELASLVNQGQGKTSAWLNMQGFVGVQALPYWSSSTNVLGRGTAWTVGMDGGPVNYHEKSGFGSVWPVRGGQSGGAASAGINLPRTGQVACFDANGAAISCGGTGQDGEAQIGANWPQPRFSDNGDQTVTDNLTGLIWIRDANLILTRDPSLAVNGANADGAVNWQDALDYLKKLNQEAYLGFSDWRLPNRNELASVMNYVEINPFAWLNWQGFYSVQAKYWSSGTVASATGNAWNVNTTGVILGENKAGNSGGCFVWPVRSGPATIAATNSGEDSASLTTAPSTHLAKSASITIATESVTAAAAATLSVSTATLSAGYIGTTYSQTLAATGGTAPYTWSKTSGTIPAGLTLSSAGVISGTPTSAGSSTFTVQVKDSKSATATKSLSITVNAALSVSTATLTAGYIGIAYSQTLAAAGGKTPYVWSITSGSLPAGLTLGSAGVLSGTPTTVGSSSFTVQAMDANNKSATKALTLTINAAPGIGTSTLPDGYVGTTYSQTLAATGGKTPYTWTRTAGTLPAGLSLSSAGVISGTPTAAGTGSFTVQVKDANNATSAKSLSLTVYAALSVSTASLPASTVGSAYSQTLAAIGGKTPYTWSVSSGTLPVGLNLAATGVIAGTPTVAGSGSVTFQVKDANNKTATRALTITVNSTPLAVTTAALPDGVVGAPYSLTLSASGGKTPYTWSRTSGTLPAGLTLSSAGVLSGTLTAIGSRTFTVQAKDANNATATKPLTMNVNSPVSIDTFALADGYVGYAYSQMLTAVGGTAPYIWSVTTGSLPAGLTLNAATGGISGTPNAAGSATFTVQVKDANNTMATGQLGIYVHPAVSVSTEALPDDYIGFSYNQTLSAVGGRSPYSWAITSGTLPGGLTLAPDTGVISGIPTVAGTGNFTVQVKDINDATSTRPLTIAVTGFAAISGIVTDKDTGAPLPGVNVTLALSGIMSKDPNDRVYTCNGVPVNATDYAAAAANDSVKTGCSTAGGVNTMGYKVRNPFGVSDPFTINWNGISGITDHVEYLAQSFKPTRNGNLTKASFYLPAGTGGRVGQVWVQLKTSLGGDRGSRLAESVTYYVDSLPNGTAAWVDFTFPNPVPVVAGQTYYLEIQGSVLHYNALDSIYWGDNVTYGDGGSFYRIGGVWAPMANSLTFRTYLDDQADSAVGPVDNYSSAAMSGHAYQQMNMMLFNRVDGYWHIGGDVWNHAGEHIGFSDGGFVYNGDDLTIFWPVSAAPEQYYDQNGWLEISVDNYSTRWITRPATSLVTDQFSLTFNRTLTAVTDANGVYSFQSLPDGNYAVTYNKTSYVAGTTGGVLPAGQVLNLPLRINKAPPASLQGTVTCNGVAVAGASVTVTDSVGTKSAVADGQGNYLISNIASGNYTIAFDATGLNRLTLTGALTPGQAGVVTAAMTPVPIALTITSPADGAVVSLLPLSVSGSVQNADTVTVTASSGGTGISYPAVIAGGIFTFSIPLDAGDTAILVRANNRYGQSTVKNLTVTRAPFTIRNLGDIGNVAVMETTGNYDGKNPDGTINDQPRKTIAAEYFRTHGDLDFLVMLSTFDYVMPDAGAQGFYLGVKNDTQGIGQSLFDNSSSFGSAGKLQGTIDLGNVTALAANPYGPKLDQTITVLNHELMHRFGAYVRFKNPDGTLNTNLLGKDAAHWSYLLDSKGSLMYGNGWQDNGNGTFTATSATSGYSPLDLYLMGMIPKEQVPPMLLIDNPAIGKTQLPQLGATITGTAKTVTIDDIIAAEGPRIPNATSSPKKFTVGFVLLTRSGDNAVTAAVIETLRTAWAGQFAEQSQGIGGVNGVAPSVSVMVDSPSDGATITGPDVTVTGSVVNTTGAETGITVNGMPATISGSRFVANHVPLQQGTNSIAITATDANGLTSTASRNVTAASGNYLRITSNVESGTGPMDISLRLDSSFSIANPTLTTSGPVPVTLTPGTSTTEFTATVTVEGIYTITASAVGPDGQTYTDMVTITVVSRLQLEALLKAKWEGMKQKVITGDTQGVGAYFPLASRDMFQAIFSDANIDSVSRLNEVTAIEIYTISDGSAQGGLIRQDDDGVFSYPVSFTIDEFGLWRIYNF